MLTRVFSIGKAILMVLALKNIMLSELASVPMESIRSLVLSLPRRERERLLEDIAESIKPNKQMDVVPPRSQSQMMEQLQDLWAMFPSDMPSYTDEELDDMKLQWRLEKYG